MYALTRRALVQCASCGSVELVEGFGALVYHADNPADMVLLALFIAVRPLLWYDILIRDTEVQQTYHGTAFDDVSVP